jgi:superkiller protein 3
LRLGEAYANSGRHVAALKALERSKALDANEWMCDFHVGQVHRQLGDHQLAVDAFLEILSQHEEDVVKAALAETRLEMAQAFRSSGFIDRARDSWVMALREGLGLTESVGARGVAWKVVSDALANLAGVLHGPLEDDDSLIDALLCAGTLLQEQWGNADEPLASLVDISTVVNHLRGEEHGSVLEAGVIAGRLDIAACSYRVHLAGTVDASLSSALFDLAASLFNYCTRIAVIPDADKIYQTASSLLKRGLRLSPGDEAYWNALGTLSFNTNPKLAQHSYIKALEIDSKVILL